MKILNQYTIPGTFSKQWEKTEDGFLRCRARVLREGVMPYGRAELKDIPNECFSDPIRMLVSMDSMSSGDSLRSLEGSSVVVGQHAWVIPENAKSVVQGHVAGSPRVDGPFLEVDLLVTDPIAIARIESGEFPEISAAYHAESVFEPGEFDGQEYDAKQVRIRYNHIAVIPSGMGRAGADVKILNVKGDDLMEGKMFRVILPRTGRYVNTDEEGARDLAEENKKSAEVEDGLKGESEAKSASLEETMSELEEKNGEAEALQAEIDELKGELSVYKEKLDELLSDEALEGKAEEMIEEQGDADEIIENASLKDEKGEELDERKKEEIKNSFHSVHGLNLHTAVLQAIGVKVENMSPEAIRGAFRAQCQISRSVGKRKTVSGARMHKPDQIKNSYDASAQGRTALQRLGFKSE